jgi:hypothetical protein
MKMRFLFKSIVVFVSSMVIFNVGCKLKDSSVIDPLIALNDIPALSNLQYSNTVVDTDTMFVNGTQKADDLISLSSLVSIRCSNIRNDFSFNAHIKDPSTGQILSTINLSGTDSIYTGIIYYSILRSFVGKLQISANAFSTTTESISLQSDILITRNNKIPVISSVSLPDTIVLSSVTQTIKVLAYVKDDNGLKDITKVQLTSFRLPDTTTVRSTLELYDDGGKNGAAENTDFIAADGIYTLSIQLPSTTIKATYRFVFQAFDKTTSSSNKIFHDIVIQ